MGKLELCGPMQAIWCTSRYTALMHGLTHISHYILVVFKLYFHFWLFNVIIPQTKQLLTNRIVKHRNRNKYCNTDFYIFQIGGDMK